MTSLSAAPSLRLSLSVYTLWSHHTDKHVSMCSLFIALIPPHSSSLLLCSVTLFWCSDSNGLYTLWWRSAQLWETETKRHTGIWPADISLVVWYSMNETPLALVCLECVCKKRWWRRNKDLLRDLYSPDRETKRWRDKIERPRQKRERRSETEIARVRNNLFSLCAWLAGVLYLTPSPNTACLHAHKHRKKSSHLYWYLGGRPHWAGVFHSQKLSSFENVFHCG